MEKETKVFVIAVSLLIVVGMQGYAATSDEHTTSSNVTISNYVAVGLSTNLSTGILFGEIDPNTLNNNATHNYDGVATATTYYVDVSSDSNINIDMCIKDNTHLTRTAGGVIANGNYTWADNATANSVAMSPANSYVMPTAYHRTNVTDIAPGSNDYFRFWLDVPGGQTPGSYNNTVYFKGIVTAGSC